MRIAVDARCLNTPRLRGMGKVLLELLQQGLERTDWTFVLLGDEPGAPFFSPEDDRIVKRSFEVKGHRFRLWEQVGLPTAARRENCDVLHCVSSWAPWHQPLPTVVTLHDTMPWVEEHVGLFLGTVAPAAYKRAAAIITASDNSRRDIETKWPALAGKITVAPWGISEAYLRTDVAARAADHRSHGIRGPYLLYLGGEIPRKRLDWALRVWAAVDVPNLQLVLCGLAHPQESPWMSAVPERLRDRIVILPFVDEAEMPALYADAVAVLYPTLYEGFGLPAVESQAVGTPVLMSAVGSLSELAGPGAIVLPVDDFDAWVRACRGAASWKAMHGAASRAWARRFTWAAAWDHTAAVYRRVVQER